MAMLAWAHQQIGKPFSSMGMMRSMIWPRATDESSWYCAELVAACLQAGGLMSRDSTPGSATPYSLYKLYKSAGAMQANPCTLRREFGISRPMTLTGPRQSLGATIAAQPVATQISQSIRTAAPEAASRRRLDSPPRMQFRVLQARGQAPAVANLGAISLSLASLNMNHSHR